MAVQNRIDQTLSRVIFTIRVIWDFGNVMGCLLCLLHELGGLDVNLEAI